MDTSRVDGVKAPPHDGTPSTHRLLLGPVVVVLQNPNNSLGRLTDAFPPEADEGFRRVLGAYGVLRRLVEVAAARLQGGLLGWW